MNIEDKSDKLEIIDSKTFSLLTRLKVNSIYKYSNNVWYCQTIQGSPLTIKYEKGFLSMGFGENEYESNTNLIMIAVKETYPNDLELKEILDFMGWKVDDENVWDG